MDYDDASHIAFFDESNWNIGRFRAISMISMKKEAYSELNNKLKKICQKKNSEIKWTKIKEQVGRELINFAIDNVHNLRIDILVWNMEDSRHRNVKGRDDMLNLERLYYRLMHTVMRDRWSNDATWALFPDEQKGIDWNTVRYYLKEKSVKNTIEIGLNQRINFVSEIKYKNAYIHQCKSHEYPFIQLADFFAGLACYSRTEFCKILNSKDEIRGQNTIFEACGMEPDDNKNSNRDRNRIPLVWHLKTMSFSKKLGISLESTKGLQTRDPRNHLNFWLYTPQHERDKAPSKTSKL